MPTSYLYLTVKERDALAEVLLWAVAPNPYGNTAYLASAYGKYARALSQAPKEEAALIDLRARAVRFPDEEAAYQARAQDYLQLITTLCAWTRARRGSDFLLFLPLPHSVISQLLLPPGKVR